MKTGSTVKRQSTGKEDPVYKMGKKRMKNEWTEQDLRQFVESSRPVFQDVSLTQVDEDADRCWQDDGLMVDYELRGGQVDCVLRRCVVADGKVWQLQMTAPLAGNDLPEDRMTPREREMCRDDMNHDLSLIHISEPTRRTPISYAVFCLKKKKLAYHTNTSPSPRDTG